MKKLLLLTTILISLQAAAQPWVSMGIGNTVNAGAGMLVDQFEIAANYQHPYSTVLKPAVASLTFGRQMLLSHNDEDNFSLTASAGIAFHSLKDATAYNQGESDVLTKVQEVKAIYGLEAGKDWYLGRLYVSAQYSGRVTAGVGIRFFFK